MFTSQNIKLLLLLLLLTNCCCCYCCRYLRRIELSKRRAKGEPKPGEHAWVVVTDIEGYSSEWLKSSSE
jgi:hypothetical protein